MMANLVCRRCINLIDERPRRSQSLLRNLSTCSPARNLIPCNWQNGKNDIYWRVAPSPQITKETFLGNLGSRSQSLTHYASSGRIPTDLSETRRGSVTLWALPRSWYESLYRQWLWYKIISFARINAAQLVLLVQPSHRGSVLIYLLCTVIK